MNTQEKAFDAFRQHINGTIEIDQELEEIFAESDCDRLRKRFSNKELIALSHNDGRWFAKAQKLRNELILALES